MCSTSKPKRKRYNKLAEVLKGLRKEFPTNLPIKLIRKKLNGYFAYCSKGSNCYYIYIHKGLDESIAIHLLLHEHAHLYPYMTAEVDHGRGWGIRYAKLYKWYEKHYLE